MRRMNSALASRATSPGLSRGSSDCRRGGFNASNPPQRSDTPKCELQFFHVVREGGSPQSYVQFDNRVAGGMSNWTSISSDTSFSSENRFIKLSNRFLPLTVLRPGTSRAPNRAQNCRPDERQPIDMAGIIPDPTDHSKNQLTDIRYEYIVTFITIYLERYGSPTAPVARKGHT